MKLRWDGDLPPEQLLPLLTACDIVCRQRNIPKPTVELEKKSVDLLASMLGANRMSEGIPVKEQIMGFRIVVVEK